MVIVGQNEIAIRLLDTLRSAIPPEDPFISEYYCYQSSLDFFGPDHGNTYADSALAYFKNSSRKSSYPGNFRQALFIKGDACFKNKKYLAAISYYAQAKELKKAGDCDDGDLAVKIAGVYYEQGNYRIAARYFIEKYQQVISCPSNLTPEKKFITLQANLNNAGFSYERAGLLDSAMFYYRKDLNLIDSADRLNLAAKRNIDAARSVVFDNLGGVFIQQRKIDAAVNYLSKSIDLSNEETNPTKVTTYIKLADAYVISGKLDMAKAALDHCVLLLKRYPNDEFNARRFKVLAAYLFKRNLLSEAYKVQSRYMHLQDSLGLSKSELYKTDIARQVNNLQEQARVSDLEQKAKYRKLYLAVISAALLFATMIIILIVRSLRRTQKARENATIQNQKLEQALAELERVNQNYIKIMRIMAHDLRNPLGGISGLAQLLLDDDELNEESRHMLRLIETTSIHSLEMINELLKSDLGDSGPLQKDLTDLNALLYESVELLQFKANEKEQQISYTGKSGPVMVNLHYEKMWRVINNLVMNALKFSHVKGTVEVALLQKEDHVIVTIADRGIGIPEKHSELIYEMFTPAKRVGTNGEQPFGLGLSISKNIVERHGGEIWFENRSGGGTIFSVRLPI
ncbi:HAMP domain-containing sensor histidine kinase [Mucilaginibacter galii]|uniref:histidine kinase n=1 Tax=Mucilaginibacter galii TaxID=2005073 RepID=A0A917N1P4_9SPHI|nr:hypothetical protein GCM10011425_23080 [Mucilaginibacter galii]